MRVELPACAVEQLQLPPPRPESLVARCLESFSDEVNRKVRLLAAAFLTTAVAGGAILCIWGSVDATTAASLVAVIVVYCGLLPTWAIRWYLRRDISALRRLVRNGIAYPARVARHTVYGYGGYDHFVLSWEEDGHRAAAAFDVLDLDHETDRCTNPVLAIPRYSRVAALLPDGRISIGVRRRR